MEKEKYLKYINNLIESYDAYYVINKYSDLDKTTHATEFIELTKLLENNEQALNALGWIRNCYDCYYKKELDEEENQDNAFNFLKNKIIEMFEEE